MSTTHPKRHFDLIQPVTVAVFKRYYEVQSISIFVLNFFTSITKIKLTHIVQELCQMTDEFFIMRSAVLSDSFGSYERTKFNKGKGSRFGRQVRN